MLLYTLFLRNKKIFTSLTMAARRARAWCLTINNWEKKDKEAFDHEDIQYYVYGEEVGEEEGTEHLQAYVEFKRRKTFSAVKGIFPTAHIEVRMGKQEQAIAYCQKGDVFTFAGEMMHQGERADLCRVRQAALDGGMRTVTRSYNDQACRSAMRFLEYNEEERDEKPSITWIWGPTGSGKSKLALELSKEEDRYTKTPDGTQWWPGYDGQTCVIFDDFTDSQFPFKFWLCLTDRYGCRVQNKGGYRQFAGTRILVTSIKEPSEYYKGVEEQAREQMLRRIDEIIELP